jgi:hypothetical protein
MNSDVLRTSLVPETLHISFLATAWMMRVVHPVLSQAAREVPLLSPDRLGGNSVGPPPSASSKPSLRPGLEASATLLPRRSSACSRPKESTDVALAPDGSRELGLARRSGPTQQPPSFRASQDHPDSKGRNELLRGYALFGKAAQLTSFCLRQLAHRSGTPRRFGRTGHLMRLTDAARQVTLSGLA